MASGAPFSPGAILGLASALRDNSWPSFCFGTDVTPFDSGNSLIYAVNFPDHVTWAVHVPVQAATSLTSQSLSSFVESQAATLIQLEQAGFRWSPRLIHYDIGHDNLVKLPYLVLSWIQGRELEWTDTVPPKPDDREKILRQVVDIRLELAERTKVLHRETSALAFLTRVVNGKVMRAVDGEEPLFSVRDCLIHRALLRYVAHKSPELEPSIVAISHENLAAHNIIVDSDYNITGIVGWCFARTLPLQLAFRLPRFLATEPDSPKQTASPPPADIPAFAKQYLQPSAALMADRYFVRMYLATLVSEAEEGGRGSLAQTMKEVISDPDASWSYLIIEACFSKGLHAWLANRSWLLHGTEREMASLVDMSSEKVMHELEEVVETEGTHDNTLRERLLRAINSS